MSIKLPTELQKEIEKSAERIRWLGQLTRNARPPSKHAAGRAGQKAKAKAKRRGRSKNARHARSLQRRAQVTARSLYSTSNRGKA